MAADPRIDALEVVARWRREARGPGRGGSAAGVALLGTLFSNDVKDEVLARTAAFPGLSARGPEIASAVQSGQIGNVIARLPAPARQVVGTITRGAFTTGLDRILLVAAIIAFVAGVVSLAAIRSRDFARAAPGGQEGPGNEATRVDPPRP